MSRQFTTVDYEATLNSSVRLGDCLPPDPLARYVVDRVSQLDLSKVYARYGRRGGAAYAPEILLGLLFYAYATGVFSSRKIEQGTRETAAFRYLAGNPSPDHDPIAPFRKTFLPELRDLFVQILSLAQEMQVLQLRHLRLGGTQIPSDASKSQAVSYKRLLEWESRRGAEVEELFALAEKADHQSAAPEGMNRPEEIARREDRLARLAEAKAALPARAQERYVFEQAAYEAKQRERPSHQERTGKKPKGRPPLPPTPGPKDKDPYNFTDPDSRIRKNSRDDGFDQPYNAQAALDQQTLLIVGCSVSHHPNDQAEVEPTVASIPSEIGVPKAAALDTGSFREANVSLLQGRGIDPFIAPGRDLHNQGWRAYFAQAADPPPETASLREQRASKLGTVLGKKIYRLRKCTIEPLIGQIKAVMGFRPFSFRGLGAVSGEGCLVCLAFNLRRLHVLRGGVVLR